MQCNIHNDNDAGDDNEEWDECCTVAISILCWILHKRKSVFELTFIVALSLCSKCFRWSPQLLEVLTENKNG